MFRGHVGVQTLKNVIFYGETQSHEKVGVYFVCLRSTDTRN